VGDFDGTTSGRAAAGVGAEFLILALTTAKVATHQMERVTSMRSDSSSVNADRVLEYVMRNMSCRSIPRTC
jgi:hypothetical protein